MTRKMDELQIIAPKADHQGRSKGLSDWRSDKWLIGIENELKISRV